MIQCLLLYYWGEFSYSCYDYLNEFENIFYFLFDLCVFWNFLLCACRLQFAVGENEVHDFRMIERHYFRGKVCENYSYIFYSYPDY